MPRKYPCKTSDVLRARPFSHRAFPQGSALGAMAPALPSAIFDAVNVHRGPVAEIEIPRRVPDGSPATWIPGAQI